jgi:hypothetical protein
MSSGLGVLTANLVLQKTKLDNLKHVKKLNVCGVHVSDIGVLRDAPNVEVLSLSVNSIDQLDALGEAYNLRELYLRKNCITDLNQALHLAKLPYLASLSMSENPVSSDPHYRPFLIAALPNLVKLDEQEITQWEREEAERVFPSLRHMSPPAPQQPNAQASPQRPSLSTPRLSSAASQRERESPPHAVRPTSSSSSFSLSQRPISGDYSATAYDDLPVGSRRAAAKRQQAMESSFAAAAPQQRAPAPLNASGQQPQPAAPSGPREEGVVFAVKALLNELSPSALLEIRRHIDNSLRN